MKKLLTIIVMLSFFVILLNEVFAGCTGTCTVCSSLTTKTSCDAQSGCTWNNVAKTCGGTCTACATYSSQSTCITQSGCSWADTCGDGVCASTEGCSCSDCEGKQNGCEVNYFCSGGSCAYSGSGGTCAQAGGTCLADTCGTYLSCDTESGGTCTTGYCCTGTCTTEVSACGNGECESGETCLNCEVDCGTCAEEALTVAFREPINKDTLKRGTYNLKVVAFVGNNPTSSAKVTAESTLFEEKIKLYDDGVHKDEKQFDGIYANQFTIKKDVKPGEYQIRVTAEKEKSSNEQTIKITVDPKLKIKLSSFQEAYVKGERINLNGLVEDFKEPAPNVTIRLSLDRLGDALYNQTYTTNVFGQFIDSYLVSFADPDGEWKLKVTAEDKDGNEGTFEAKPNIGTPAGVAYYLINFLSPIKGSSFSRGETIPISVEITEEGQPVKEAEVTFLSPKGKYLELKELEPGVYTTNYNVLFDDPLGQWRLAVQAIKKIANITRAGGNTIPLQVKTGEIRFEILSPTEEKVFTATELTYKLKLTYPDDSLVRGANLKAELSNGQTINFIEEEPGIYTAKYATRVQDQGSLDAKILADDNKGNTATLPSILLYVKERTIIELGLFLLYQNIVRPYWWAILTFLIIAGMLYKPTYEIKSLRKKISRAKQEQAIVKEMQMEAERGYYKRKNINKADFQNLVQQYKERMAKAKELQKTSEEKLEKKLKKVKHK